MKLVLVLTVVLLALLVLVLHAQSEKYSLMPDISMGVQWGSVPKNLYGTPKNPIPNMMGEIIVPYMQEADFADFNYGRGIGIGIGDINKKMDYGLHASEKVYYI